MRVAARMNGRIARLATARHLPRRAVRVRLTLLYGALFLLSGAALMAIAYALLVNAGFVFTLQNGPVSGVVPAGASGPAPPRAALTLGPAKEPPAGFPSPGARTHPSAQTMAHWGAVAQCMRRHGVSGFPNPTTSVPAFGAGIGMISDRDGAILAMPASIDTGSSAFVRANTACGYMVPDRSTLTAANRRRDEVRQQLLIQSGIALAGMSLLSLALGWLMAGRVLQPLEDSYEAQRQFVANASHELRAPLTRQRALIEVALANPEPDVASLRATHERVLHSEEHLEQIIDGLLALTRGQAGLERRENLDLATITSQAILAREPLAHLGLDVHPTLAPAPMAGDPRLVERLIDNLVDNAIRHNAPGGHVEVTTGTRHQRAFVTVSNSGPAIPPEELPRLLEPFQRLGPARTRHNNGHGLGLSIVQAIANAHRAELTARARPQGGLTIEIAFTRG